MENVVLIALIVFIGITTYGNKAEASPSIHSSAAVAFTEQRSFVLSQSANPGQVDMK